MLVAADYTIVISTRMQEIESGPLPPREVARYSEQAGLACKIHLFTDAYNLILALGSIRLKVPTEKSFLGHLLWLRQRLSEGAIAKLVWCDTRDMTADAHTKGTIDRSALHLLMKGSRERSHEVKELILPSAVRAATSGEQAT